MMFYEADETVKTYQKFYMMGTEGMEWQPSKIKDKPLPEVKVKKRFALY